MDGYIVSGRSSMEAIYNKIASMLEIKKKNNDGDLADVGYSIYWLDSVSEVGDYFSSRNG